jgi:hypothetical protein
VEEVTGCGPELPQRLVEALSRLARSDLYDYVFVELLGDQNPLHIAQLLTLPDARGTPLSDLIQVRHTPLALALALLPRLIVCLAVCVVIGAG